MSAALSGGELIEYARQRSCCDPDGCWLWRGAVAGGSGRPIMGTPGDRPRVQLVQRALWNASHPGTCLRPAQIILMACGERRCVNPAHIRIGNRKTAMQLASARGSLSSGVRHRMAVLSARRKRSHVRLTIELVHAMRSRYAETGNAAQVGREFGIHPAHAHRVVTHRSWREPSPWAI